ncbi:hypothetical protein EK21DRAFT_90359 [Setomelanomma holmii]|uniref:Uncharacterized protein n=1 Tax=Setomelanomma holmii TaxID=210430 RepID=A0A9P4H733_9PLEO|nr:hypothetical protein EK21DRAFT_90359 [Setomelanomma holmii]
MSSQQAAQRKDNKREEKEVKRKSSIPAWVAAEAALHTRDDPPTGSDGPIRLEAPPAAETLGMAADSSSSAVCTRSLAAARGLGDRLTCPGPTAELFIRRTLYACCCTAYARSATLFQRD